MVAAAERAGEEVTAAGDATDPEVHVGEATWEIGGWTEVLGIPVPSFLLCGLRPSWHSLRVTCSRPEDAQDSADGDPTPRPPDHCGCVACGRQLAWPDHGYKAAAHQLQGEDVGTEFEAFSSPDAIAHQVVKMAREAGAALESMTWRFSNVRDACNFDVAVAFVRTVQVLAQQKPELAAVECVYHWTRKENARQIMENSLRVPGEVTADGRLVEVRHRQSYGRGIYAATDLNYGRSFGGKRPCVFLCLAVAGHVQEVCSRSTSINWADEWSVGSVRRGPLRMYRRSEQILPLFITDAANDAHLRPVAQHIAALIMRRVCDTQLAHGTPQRLNGELAASFNRYTGYQTQTLPARTISGSMLASSWCPVHAPAVWRVGQPVIAQSFQFLVGVG